MRPFSPFWRDRLAGARVTLDEQFALTDANGTVEKIQVKQTGAASSWIWGAFKMPGQIFTELRSLWHDRKCQDEYFGTLVNAYLEAGGNAVGVKAGEAYVDIGTLNGYRTAIGLLTDMARGSAETADAAFVGWPAGRWPAAASSQPGA